MPRRRKSWRKFSARAGNNPRTDSMKARALETPAVFRWRPQTSPALLALAALPIAVIALFVAVMIWVSFQRGMLGTAAAVYTPENYFAIFSDPFLYRVLWNTAVF